MLDYEYDYVTEDDVMELMRDSDAGQVAEDLNVTRENVAELEVLVASLTAQLDQLMDERAARIDARLSNRLRRLWGKLKGLHWYSPFMPRR